MKTTIGLNATHGGLPLYPQPLPERSAQLLRATLAVPAIVAALAVIAAARGLGAAGRVLAVLLAVPAVGATLLIVAGVRLQGVLRQPRLRPLLGVLVLLVAVALLRGMGVDGTGAAIFALAVGVGVLVLWLLPEAGPREDAAASGATVWMASPRPDFGMLHLTGQPGLGGAAAWEAVLRFDRTRDDVLSRAA